MMWEFLRFVEWPWALPLIVLLPVFTWWALRRARRSRRLRLAVLGTRSMVARLAPHAHRIGRMRIIRLTLAAFCLAIAFAGPRWGVQSRMVRSSGIDVVFALDASLSMMATDESPNRLTAMKQVARHVRALSPSDRFGLVAFAGRAYVLTPMTMDQGALGLYLDNLDPSTVGQVGSTLASAIQQSTLLLSLNREGGRAIVVMSDGEAFESQDDIVAAAQQAGRAGIDVIMVGFGTERGSTIPVENNRTAGTKRDDNGQVVISRYMPVTLRAAADAAHGRFIPAEAPNKAAYIRQALDQLQANPRTIATGERLSLQYQWFLVVAVLLLLADALLALRTTRRVPYVQRMKTVATMLAVLAFGACRRDEEGRAIAWYNQGTTLIQRDAVSEAHAVLDSAARGASDSVRAKVAFNDGWAYLRTGLQPSGDSAAAPLDSALARYRTALTVNPDELDAKWNYELALRAPRSGGGGGGAAEQNGGGAEPEPRRETPAPTSLEERQAEALLNSAEREERNVQARRQQRTGSPPPPGGKDW